MDRHREFTAARAEQRAEPLIITIHSATPQHADDPGAAASWTFTLPFVPAGPLLDVSAAMLEGGLAIVVAFGQFLHDVVPEDQRPALKEALLHVDISVATDMATWIIEQAVARPLGSQSESAAGESSNGAASKLAAASIGWTPSE